MIERFPAEEYALPFFKKSGYTRKRCPCCADYFWTLNPEQKTCGEASAAGCDYYTFIRNPPTRRSYAMPEMREAFLSYFEKHGHSRVKPYPVVARWREDIYLTHASIIDFQPYVTEGISPPPANPLVISQPCIRMVDIANTGPTFGRHLTIFEMGGAHAFNYPDKEVYWKDQTVSYHQDWVVSDLGVKPEEIVYKEGVWVGGGNAGPDVECIIRGLEVATLVFMQFKVVNDEFVKLPIRTVDTGYGIDRYAWLSQGAISGFHAVYGPILDRIFEKAGMTDIDNAQLAKIAAFSGLVNLDKTASRLELRKREATLSGMSVEDLDKFLEPIENAFAVADHTKSLSFILAEGVVPSNIQEGYLARLLFRRIYRLLRLLKIPDQLYEIVNMQMNMWGKDYPQLTEMHDEIIEMLKVEEEKFEDTIHRGESMVKRLAIELRAKRKKTIPIETITQLYDSHGLPPEILKETAEKEHLTTEIPDNFYALIAQKHMQVTKKSDERKNSAELLEDEIKNLPETLTLYYQDQYKKEFEAKVLKIINNEYAILDRTCFYPEGGGQPGDTGTLIFGENKTEVIDTQKVNRIIVHRLKGVMPKTGATVRGKIDWDKRYALMRNHTATHVIGGAAKRVLGQHVWQYGTQKGVVTSRLDVSHYRRLSLEELHEIERLANETIERGIPVETKWMPRNEAESLYGFRLYQGGAVPGKEIRVVRAGDWDVEACAGTHLANTSEVGLLKIVHSERVQDGVERLTYSVGLTALKAVQANESLLRRVSEILQSPLEKLDNTTEKLVKELKEANVQRRRLLKELSTREGAGVGVSHAEETEKIDGVKLIVRDFRESLDVERMVQTANETIKRDETTVAVYFGSDGKNARIMVTIGKGALEKGIDAGEMVRKASGILGGGGGGRPNFAQGGGTRIEKMDEAISKMKEIVKNKLTNR